MKKYVVAFLVNSLVIVWLSACQNKEAAQTIVPEVYTVEKLENGNIVVTANNFMGVILSNASVKGNSDYWMPEVDDILALEGGIEGYLSENSFEFHSDQAPMGETLANYHRQYYGVIQDDRKAIIGFYFCYSAWDNDEWKTGFIDARGGGDCFFHVEYDVSKGSFNNIWVNAPL